MSVWSHDDQQEKPIGTKTTINAHRNMDFCEKLALKCLSSLDSTCIKQPINQVRDFKISNHIYIFRDFTQVGYAADFSDSQFGVD